MAKRFCDTEIWDKQWFMDLSCKHKCLIRFIFDKCDVAGIWEPNYPLATLYVGEKCTAEDLSVFGDHLIKIPGGKILVVDFISFQYGRLSESSNPHLKVINILKKYNLYEGYLKGTLGVMEEEEDKEEDKAKEEVKEKGVKKTFDYGFVKDEFREPFMNWIEYKIAKKQMYKNQKSLEASYKTMLNLAGNDPVKAVEVVDFAMGNNYTGMVPLKNNSDNGKQQTTSELTTVAAATGAAAKY